MSNNNEIHYCGVTFHELTSLVDGGAIYHQYAVDKYPYESIHHLGNSLIKRVPAELLKVLEKNPKGVNQDNKFFPENPRRYYTNSDYTKEKTQLVNEKFT